MGLTSNPTPIKNGVFMDPASSQTGSAATGGGYSTADWKSAGIASARSRSPWEQGFWREALGVFGSWVLGRCRLHGPRQLGERHRRRLGLRLPASFRHFYFEPDGGPPSDLVRPLGDCDRPRLGTGLPGALLALGLRLSLACLRGAIAACDLAEVIGTAIALNLLFHIPIVWGVLLTALDVLIVLWLAHHGFRWLETLVVSLVLLIGVCFGLEIFFSKPDMAELVKGWLPSVEIVRNPAMLYVSIAIIGATVMPHNLYLHSSIAERRASTSRTTPGKKKRFVLLQSMRRQHFSLLFSLTPRF